MTLIVVAISLVTYMILAYFLSRIFEKVGLAPWKAWVPVYCNWLLLRLGNQPGWMAIILVVPILNFIAFVYFYLALYTIGLKFGKDKLFVAWALFFPVAWYAILAFDSSQWERVQVQDGTDTPTRAAR